MFAIRLYEPPEEKEKWLCWQRKTGIVLGAVALLWCLLSLLGA